MGVFTVSRRIREFVSASVAYFSVSVFFFFGLLISRGDVAQQDFGIPLTVNAALHDAHSLLFAGLIMLWWNHSPLGLSLCCIYKWYFGSFGFFGGTEVKLLAVFLFALSG